MSQAFYLDQLSEDVEIVANGYFNFSNSRTPYFDAPESKWNNDTL